MIAVLAGAAAFVGLQHLWFWLERPDEHLHPWMVALAVGTLIFLRGFHLQIASDAPAPAIEGVRLQWTGGAALVIVLIGLVNRFIGRPAPRRLFVITSLGGAVYVVCTWLTELVVVDEAVLRTPAGWHPYWGVTLGPLTTVFVPFMLAMAVYCVTVLARARDLDLFERVVLLFAVGLYLMAGMNEVLGGLRLVATVRLFPPAFTLVCISFSLLLAQRFDAMARDNERLLVEMRAQARVLEARNAELDAFAYTASHDLKAPLVSIEGMADVLHEQGADALDRAERQVVQRIAANVQRMKRLIADLLAFSRVGREAHDLTAIPLLAVVDAVIDEFAVAVRERGITVTRPAPATVWGTQTHVEQVFRNLIDNAVRAVRDTTVPVIEIFAVDHGATVECAVRDNGTGIDPADHARMFEMFLRLDDRIEGTGVGLALVKKIVELNGGRVWVESAKGRGATFSFTWPTAPAPATRAPSA